MILYKCIFYLKCVEALSESNSHLANELCDLLTSYEMEGLLQSHDSIASLTDRAYRSQSITPLHNVTANVLNHDNKSYSSSSEDIKKVRAYYYIFFVLVNCLIVLIKK